MSDIQLDLFGEPIQPKRQKKAKPVQGELFPAAELAQFGVRANPVMDESPGKLALQIQDVRTPDEIERDKMRTAEVNTLPLPGTESLDVGNIAAVVHDYMSDTWYTRNQAGQESPVVKRHLKQVKDLFWGWPILMQGGGRIVRAPYPSAVTNAPAEPPAPKQQRITPYQKAMLLLIHTGKQDKHNPMILASLTARKLVTRHEGRLVLTDAGRAYLQF